MSTICQNLSLCLKESAVTIRNFLKDSSEMEQVAHKSCLKKLEALAFDVDNVLDELNKIEINNNKLTPEDVAEIGKEKNTEKHNLKHSTMAIFIPGIKVLLEKLVSYTAEAEFRLLWNSEEEKEKLTDSVTAIQNLLDDAEKRQVSDEPTIKRLRSLEAVAFEADYVFEELAYELLRRKVMGDKHRFTDYFSFSVNPMIFRHKIAVKVEAIHKKVKQINEMASAFSLPTRSGKESEAPTRKETSSTNSDVGEKFVGREKDVMKLVNMVTGAPTKKELISTLPIVGMGGLGKSTLARRVFNDDRIISHFQARIWVQAPQKFDQELILKKILDMLVGGNNIGETNYIEQKIKENLRGKRYLLVLDDVWIHRKNIKVWDLLMSSLKAASYATGNVILVTTRINEVHWIKKPIIDVHKLGVLSDEECWSIIKAKADLEEDCPEFEVIGQQTAARCRGLPLAAEVTGGLLRGESKNYWLNIERDWKSDVENSVSSILRLSFDHLDPVVKKCFAYCAIIPKGGCVEKEELIQLWMAEGILNTKHITKEDVGEKILNHLIRSSLLQVRERDKLSGEAKTLGMHDMVVDLALSLLHSGQHCRYVFATDDPSPIQNNQASEHLRTIFLTTKFSDKELSKLQWVHTLILNSEDITELPDSIKGLIHLKYLDTSNTRIQNLPESFGMLYLLETLRATAKTTGKSSLRELPDSFTHLISLRHLYIPMIQLPPEMGKLTSLQTLPYFCVSDEVGHQIEELGKLTNLKGRLGIFNLEKVRDKEEAKSADLFHKPNIYQLKLVWNAKGDGSSGDRDKTVLEGLQPHPNLKRLEVYNFRGTSFPLWAVKMVESLENLIDLKLAGCKECEEIPMLGQLPHLKHLILSDLTKLKMIGSSIYGDEKTVSVFPQLHTICLTGLANLRVWEEVSLASPSALIFPCLESLVICDCELLECAPSRFPCLKVLVISCVKSPLPLENICGSNLTTLEKLVIKSVAELVSLPDGLFSRNRDLSEVTIEHCKNLLHLANCGASSSLRELVVSSCRNLTDFANVGGFDALEKLGIFSCPKLNPIPYSGRCIGESSPLRSLCIKFCRDGLNLEMVESCARSLELFWLKQSENSKQQHLFLMRIFKNMSSLTSLEYVFPKDMDDDVFPALPSLANLTLTGMGANSIPGNLRWCTSLQNLWLIGFGVEALPDWLGSLALQSLYICSCPKLSTLPDLNNELAELYIGGSPLLIKSLEVEPRNLNPEWSKISHIPNIQLDSTSMIFSTPYPASEAGYRTLLEFS